MNYGLTTVPTLHANECLVIGILGHSDLPKCAHAIDKEHNGLFTRLALTLTESGDTAEHIDTHTGSLFIIHCGEKNNYTPAGLLKRVKDIADFLFKKRMTSATLSLPQLTNQTPDWQIQQMLLQFESQRYQLLDFKTKESKPRVLKSLHFHLEGAHQTSVRSAFAIAEGMDFTRTLANYPANICTPTYVAQQAIKLAHQHTKLDVKILDRDQMYELGMGSLLAVAQGSHESPQFIELQYHGAGNDSPPVVLVGKGITFDSGGISIKPADGMHEMKYDMAGAASVLGTLKACALLNLPINVVGLLACAENMPGGGAIKPGDIVTSSSGQTIEITNTDAEGRLVLADALTYAERFHPRLVIDIATLTGAVIIALGSINTGIMTNDDELANLILEASRTSGDKAWRLPIDEDYLEAMDSPIADMVNSSIGRGAGSITGACFLSKFTGKYRWAHLDIAGTAWVSGAKRHATGRPVPLLVQLLRDLADAS